MSADAKILGTLFSDIKDQLLQHPTDLSAEFVQGLQLPFSRRQAIPVTQPTRTSMLVTC